MNINKFSNSLILDNKSVSSVKSVVYNKFSNSRILDILFVLFVFALTSCTSESESSSALEAPVTVSVSDFAVTVSDFPDAQTRAVSPASYADVKALTLIFFKGTENVYEATQWKSDATSYTTFGVFTCSLPVGTYTMVVVGRNYSDGDEFAITSPTAAAYTSERVRETFNYSEVVTIADTNPVNLSATLSRIVARLIVKSTDPRPAEAVKIRTTYAKGGKGFDPSSGLATTDAGYTLTNTPTAAAGQTAGVFNFVFLASDEETMTITIEALDAANTVLSTKVVPNVPMKRNKTTMLSGAIYTDASTATSTFDLDTDWLPGTTTINF